MPSARGKGLNGSSTRCRRCDWRRDGRRQRIAVVNSAIGVRCVTQHRDIAQSFFGSLAIDIKDLCDRLFFPTVVSSLGFYFIVLTPFSAYLA